ncbi:hypothetical protein ACNQFZ_11960 [Schinkia sp. CFF1]
MDIKYLEACVKAIKVKNLVNADVEVSNKSPLTMIGKGRQGAVFKVTDDICVKVFGNQEDCDREYYALSLGQKSSLFPKVYAKGSLYIAMDIIKGVDVREYLQSQPLSEELSAKLIEMLITFKEIGYERIDHHKRQIYIQPDGNLKVIDVARTVWRDRVYPYPRKLLTSLGEENKAIFLTHVQEMAPELYQEWLHYMEMEEQARKVYQSALSKYNSSRKDELKNKSKQLLSTNNQQAYAMGLEGLMHKVFKEEWVKTMLALGYDPDDVMEKIDAYWDSREQEAEFNWEKDPKKGKRDEKGKKDKKDKKDKKEKDKDKKDKHGHGPNKWNKVQIVHKGRYKGRLR